MSGRGRDTRKHANQSLAAAPGQTNEYFKQEKPERISGNVGLVSSRSLLVTRGRRGFRGIWSYGMDGCRRGSPVVDGGVYWPKPDRRRHFVPGCMGGPEIEDLAVAFGKRGNDLCCQRHLAHCHMYDDAILCSGLMDKSFPLYSLGMFSDVSAATSYVATASYICDSYRYDDPWDYIVACATDARFSNGMNASKRIESLVTKAPKVYPAPYVLMAGATHV